MVYITDNLVEIYNSYLIASKGTIKLYIKVHIPTVPHTLALHTFIHACHTLSLSLSHFLCG